MFGKINIREELEKQKTIDEENKIIECVTDILQTESDLDRSIARSWDADTGVNAFNIEEINPERVFHIESIKKICVNHRMRFLNTSQFKGEIPREAYAEIKRLSGKGIDIQRCKIIAPSKMFELDKKDCDPLLMAPMGNGRYYLIYQWGSDMARYKRVLYWPLRSFPHLFYSTLALSVLITLLIPTSFLSTEPGIGYWHPVRFSFLPWSIVMIGSIVVFYWFMLHSKFSDDQWDSRYEN